MRNLFSVQLSLSVVEFSLHINGASCNCSFIDIVYQWGKLIHVFVGSRRAWRIYHPHERHGGISSQCGDQLQECFLHDLTHTTHRRMSIAVARWSCPCALLIITTWRPILCLIKHYSIKTCKVSGGIAPHIRNLAAR